MKNNKVMFYLTLLLCQIICSCSIVAHTGTDRVVSTWISYAQEKTFNPPENYIDRGEVCLESGYTPKTKGVLKIITSPKVLEAVLVLETLDYENLVLYDILPWVVIKDYSNNVITLETEYYMTEHIATLWIHENDSWYRFFLVNGKISDDVCYD